MNKKFLLTLLSTPVVFGSVISTIMLSNPAHATPSTNQVGTRDACVVHPHSATHKLVCIKVSNNSVRTPNQNVTIAQSRSNQVAELKFTDQESDEAIRLFGCDCPACVNSVRQLHGMAPMPV
ncbi:MAG: hypothetical protein DSM106950_40045 [Stigonema ocellatum SAG 48.90 = DSM 106950]|nr:hypothetical protein [Stigonema ocellatum SAG 48.90 = DSM 106950]